MQERRRQTRTKVQKNAQVVINSRAGFVGCTVRDISTLGACIDFFDLVDLPDAFVLSFDSFRSARMCQVKWRTPYRVGVAFLQPDVARVA